jgi:hypothetical protein
MSDLITALRAKDATAVGRIASPSNVNGYPGLPSAQLPLHIAINSGSDYVRMLLEAGATPTTEQMCWAVQWNKLNSLKLLLAATGQTALPNAEDMLEWIAHNHPNRDLSLNEITRKLIKVTEGSLAIDDLGMKLSDTERYLLNLVSGKEPLPTPDDVGIDMIKREKSVSELPPQPRAEVTDGMFASAMSYLNKGQIR